MLSEWKKGKEEAKRKSEIQRKNKLKEWHEEKRETRESNIDEERKKANRTKEG